MAEYTAQLNNLRQSPRKVRVVANLVRGKSADDAILTLQFAPKRAALPLSKLIASAVANAKAQSVDTEGLIVKNIEVNVGKTLMRRRPIAHGSAHPIHKRTSHIFVSLAPKINKADVALPAPKTETKKVEIAPKLKASKATKATKASKLKAKS
jgi:large subunit ribosomal protein L22